MWLGVGDFFFFFSSPFLSFFSYKPLHTPLGQSSYAMMDFLPTPDFFPLIPHNVHRLLTPEAQTRCPTTRNKTFSFHLPVSFALSFRFHVSIFFLFFSMCVCTRGTSILQIFSFFFSKETIHLGWKKKKGEGYHILLNTKSHSTHNKATHREKVCFLSSIRTQFLKKAFRVDLRL